MSGKWVVIEGIDGCGKGTVRQGLHDHWLAAGTLDNVVFVREPGGTPFGERVRELLLHTKESANSPLAEMMLFFAARAQLISDVVVPALAEGKLVVSERNWVSTLVMQGLTPETEAQVGAMIGMLNDAFHVNPDLYLYLDIDLETSLQRKASMGGLDTIEQRGRDYFAAVLGGYRKWAAEQFVWTGSEVIDTPVVKINGELPRDEILKQSLDAIAELTR